MSKPPAFQFYPRDWLEKRVLRMSDAAQGVYMRLLCYMWMDSDDQCSIEKDDKMIAKILSISVEKWQNIRKHIMWKDDPILIETDTHYISARLRQEKQKQDIKSGKAHDSAMARWDANALIPECERNANAMRTQCSSSSTSTSITPPIVPPLPGGDALEKQEPEKPKPTKRGATIHPVPGALPYKADQQKIADADHRLSYAAALREKNLGMCAWFDRIVKAPLQRELTEQSYTAFIAGLTPVSVTYKAVVLFHPDSGSCDWIRQHYLPRIAALIQAEDKFEKCAVSLTAEMEERP